MDDLLTLLEGDAVVQLRTLETGSVHCVVTSPPYWGLRDYSTNGQLGLEKTPEEYVAKMVEVFREVRRVLCKDGTLWLNLGDSYGARGGDTHTGFNERWANNGIDGKQTRTKENFAKSEIKTGLKPKDLCGIPWRVAFALQADGWWLRSDIIWAKPNPMPESVTDRPTKAHEYLFLLTKSANYFYDNIAIQERISPATIERVNNKFNDTGKTAAYRDEGIYSRSASEFNAERADRIKSGAITGVNKRSVWTVPTAPYPEAHFATYPPDLIKPCILAGTSARGCCAKCGAPWERVVERGEVTSTGGNVGRSIHMVGNQRDFELKAHEMKTLGWQPSCECREITEREYLYFDPVPCTVLDPFAGSGTTGMVALELGRKAILIELNPAYVKLIQERCDVTPGLALA